jgi:CBS domain-containing protein
MAKPAAIAGPAVSVGLFVILAVLSQVLAGGSLVGEMAGDLAKINLVLALFNLIPGLPLDGGQVLKAAVWKATGNRFTAVHWAAKAGVILGWSAIAAGLAIDFFTGELITGLWIALLGWFGIRNANAYNSVTSLQEILLKLVANDAISSDFRVIDADQSLRSFADSYLLQTTAPEVYFAASEGRYRGIVSVDDLRAVERSEWENKTLHDILHPLTEVPSVTESTPLVEVIERLETQQLPRMVVLSPADAVAGIIDRGDIVRAVGAKLNKPFSDADIKRVKDDGSFPPTLQLGAIAKSTKG